jgi:hypothetical protein
MGTGKETRPELRSLEGAGWWLCLRWDHSLRWDEVTAHPLLNINPSARPQNLSKVSTGAAEEGGSGGFVKGKKCT